MEEENKQLKQAVKKIFESHTDPDGWYTGVTTTEEYEKPVQDADDL